ncbi:MAG: recombination protein RecR [Candidatus Magasanikbacteria bacterium RIFCSPHIGHO2_01_FULL_41_23]|uniref:Recombination protein RecR n=1 Tax=Candidatus Magasanikbacteria bacterium RIFCSPLOWO2_01_FULL_40_15 TaxID=1798686 RepID=A0A1F6N145_9BACT|nr:MAG: recombination protein RecR [Candidatus Magasanikbacteria bacterium RIFCSPHIGHO2_01_FULL_41_23]OGH74745.1 MAG: recombination protein RecR [Candidatus Magasanikbacteria bacterium RIFCSPHIGHO2_12_FULL_41_16]OGH77383.1 MAG: recombination protein RecR [Candidatus Magasanikbacteria bacterium RIFCSPLOWO2_01_FULL_40_15]
MRLPSVGRRTAERFVFYLLKAGKKDPAELALAIKTLIASVKSCAICFDFSDRSPCVICADKNRDTTVICVVAEPQDVQAVERIGSYRGHYHILRGLVPLDAIAVDESILKIPELITRVEKQLISEVIIALNPDLPGETTAMYIEKLLKEKNAQLKITRLARGLPMGSDLQYADEITLASALKNRTTV